MYMSSRLILLLVLLGFSALPTAAKIERLLPEEHREIAELRLEQSTLQDITTLFGTADSWQRGDKHHDPFYYCYKLESENDSWAILGFGWVWSFKKLTSITVTSLKSDIAGPCNNTGVSLKALSTKGGLRLGLAEAAVHKIIQEKPTVTGDKHTYSYEFYEKYDKPRKYPTSDFTYVGEWHYGTIELEYNNGLLVKYHIWASGEPDW